MAKRGKQYLEALKKVDRERLYEPGEALDTVKEVAFAGFDETVELSVKLGVDPRQSDQQVRGAIVLPQGTGKEIRVVVFAQGEKAEEAEAAGADHVGGKELAERIEGGWMEFDAVVATPDMMKVVGPLGRILGPQGLMPSPKLGTVTFELEKAVSDLKAGQVEYRTDRAGVINVPVGKVSFAQEDLAENLRALLRVILEARPASTKGRYVQHVAVASTMGPGVKIDPSTIEDFALDKTA